MAKNKGGRPPKTLSDYLPKDWQQTVFEMSADGCSDVEIRAAFCWNGKKFNHEAWYAMIDREEEFAETIKKAKVLCQAWWEKMGRSHIYHSTGMNFETGAWYANMKNRFGWCDKKDISFDLENSAEYFKEIATAITQSDTYTN